MEEVHMAALGDAQVHEELACACLLFAPLVMDPAGGLARWGSCVASAAFSLDLCRAQLFAKA